MEKAPQAAYDSLCQHQMKFTKRHEQSVKMRYQLLKAKAENKSSCMVEVFREKFWRLRDKVLSLPSD